MDAALAQEISAILLEGKDLTLATLREDGAPQATTVSYASDGARIYFGCSPQSQKAANLTRDPRVSVTVDLPYLDWNQIRGLSLGGRARRLVDPDEIGRAGALFQQKFAAEMAQFMTPDPPEMALFEIVPQVISVLDYRKGFGHTDLVEVAGAPPTTA
ncbi:MAG TPA: pyridoxamine 5'-phosphate oxidase family protein [Phenylobacterium sp.]|nr:pyridoxamine 5'-phosphate oxidase family protein [Phenylobacterium sp.]